MNTRDSQFMNNQSQYSSLINNSNNATSVNNNSNIFQTRKSNFIINRATCSNRSWGRSLKTLNTSQSCCSHTATNKFNQYKRKINSLNDLENIYDNISSVFIYFLKAYPHQEKVDDFLTRFCDLLGGTYLDVWLAIKEFKEFNIFNYWAFSVSYTPKMSSKEFNEKKQMIIVRNNIIWSWIVVARELERWENCGEIDFQQGYPLFQDLGFLGPVIEKFKNWIIETDNNFKISYEVELFFLAILGYADKSRVIKQKLNWYFKEFLKEINVNTLNFDIFLNWTLEKTSFESWTAEELVLHRKIISNACLRNFSIGIEFWLQKWKYCLLISEGRIWKNIGLKMEPVKVFNLWRWYEEKLNEIRQADARESLWIEYKIKIKNIHLQLKTFKDSAEDLIMNDQYNQWMYEKNSHIKEIYLYTVSCLSELLVIFFRFELKELVMFFFDQYKWKESEIPRELYEISMDYDEDISIDILDMTVNSATIKKWYIELAMLKKYFRWARKLLKFPVCQQCLNSVPPDTEDYIAHISKIKVMQKKKWFEKIKFQKGNEDLKIIDFIQENSTFEDKDECNWLGTPMMTGVEKVVEEKLPGIWNKRSASDVNVDVDADADADKKKDIALNGKNSSQRIWKERIKYPCNNIFKAQKPSINNMNVINSNSNNTSDNRSDHRFLDSENRNNLWLLLNSNKKDERDMSGGLSTNTNVSNSKTWVKSNHCDQALEDKLNLSDTENNYHQGNSNNDASFLNLNCPKAEENPPKVIPDTNPFAINVGKRRRSVLFGDNPFTSDGIIKLKEGHINVTWSQRSNPKTSGRLLSFPASKTWAGPEIDGSNERPGTSDVNNNCDKDQYLQKSNSDVFELNDIKQGKLQMNIQMLLIDHLRDGVYFFDVLCLLSSINVRYLNPDYFDKICAFLLVYSNNGDAITKCPQPLVSLALSAELLFKIGTLNPKIKYKAQSVAGELWWLAENIQTSMKDEDMLNFYLRQQCDHNNRSAWEIYAENRFYNWWNDWNVGSIVRKLWYGTGHEQSIYSFFRMTRILTSDVFREHYSPMVQLGYLPSDSVYTFQFYQFIHNCSVRNLFESASVIGITILNQWTIYLYVTFTKEDVTHPNTHFYYQLQIITNILIYLSLLNYAFLLIYFHKTGRKLKLNKYEFTLNIIMFITVTINLLNVPQVFFPVEKNHDWNIWWDGVVYSIILTIGWIKVIWILMTTNSYGPFIRITFDVIWHVFSFWIVFFCITFLFAQLFTVFFRKVNKNYYEIYDGFLSLFDTAFGQVYFDNFEEWEVFGYVAWMAYTTISNIMLFNLIVAIINNWFNNLESKADAENRAVLVLKYERIKWDERYGLLIWLPSPFNLITLLFIPWLFCVKDNLRIELNILFSKICYFPVALLQFVLLLFLGLITYPFALVKSWFHSTYDYWQINSPNRWHEILISSFARPVVLLWYLFVDWSLFWKLLYQEPETTDSQQHFEYDNVRTYILPLRKVLNDARFKDKKKTMPIHEWYSKWSIFKKPKRHNRYHTSHSRVNNATENTNMTIGLNTMNTQWEGAFNNATQTLGNSNFLTWNFIQQELTNEVNNNDDNDNNDKTNSKHISANSSASIKSNHKPQSLYPGNNNNNHLVESYISWHETSEKNKIKIREEMKRNFRKIIDKIVDPEGFIDIERTLQILPDQVKYNPNFADSLKYLSMRVFIRGLTKYFFANDISNPVYSFKKLQLLVYKLIIKFNLIYGLFDRFALDNINQDFKAINDRVQYAKTPQALKRYEEKDDISEYDDEGEFVRENIKTKNKRMEKEGTNSADTTNKDGDSDFSGGETQ